MVVVVVVVVVGDNVGRNVGLVGKGDKGGGGVVSCSGGQSLPCLHLLFFFFLVSSSSLVVVVVKVVVVVVVVKVSSSSSSINRCRKKRPDPATTGGPFLVTSHWCFLLLRPPTRCPLVFLTSRAKTTATPPNEWTVVVILVVTDRMSSKRNTILCLCLDCIMQIRRIILLCAKTKKKLRGSVTNQHAKPVKFRYKENELNNRYFTVTKKTVLPSCGFEIDGWAQPLVESHRRAWNKLIYLYPDRRVSPKCM